MRRQARIERRLLALLMRLPVGARRRIAASLERVDGRDLNDEVRLVMALSAARRPLEQRPVENARRF